MTKRIRALLAALLLGAGLSLPTLQVAPAAEADEVLPRLSADHVVTALRASGATGMKTSTDSHGDPQITGEFDGISFDVLFYGCSNDRCQKVQFRVQFEDDEMPADKARSLMGDWNREWVFGKAYIDANGYMVLEHAIYARDGVTRANLEHNTGLWVELIGDFTEAIGWN